MYRNKITLEMEDRTFTIEIPEDMDAYDVVDILRLVMKMLTFGSDSIKELMPGE